MMKPFAKAPLEQKSESSTIVFLVPDNVLRMPLAYWSYGLKEYREKVYNVLRVKTWRFFYMSVHVLLHLLNEMRKLDNMWGSAKDVIIYH